MNPAMILSEIILCAFCLKENNEIASAEASQNQKTKRGNKIELPEIMEGENNDGFAGQTR